MSFQVSPIQTAPESPSVADRDGGNRPRGYVECPRCAQWWTGLSSGHCSGCHRTFTSLSAFDRHRTGSHVDGRSCLNPQTVGLIDANRAYPCWGFPGGAERFES